MPILSQPAFGPKLSIAFITGGALVDVWDLVWYFTLAPHPLTPPLQFMFWGLLLTGAVFLTIGFFLGSIGRAARKAELPPTAETTRAEAAVQAAAAANPALAPAMVTPAVTGVAPTQVVAPAGMAPTVVPSGS
ncbi:MAG: hypothetical protein U0804_27430 [Gemmataceae bacterium]